MTFICLRLFYNNSWSCICTSSAIIWISCLWLDVVFLFLVFLFLFWMLKIKIWLLRKINFITVQYFFFVIKPADVAAPPKKTPPKFYKNLVNNTEDNIRRLNKEVRKEDQVVTTINSVLRGHKGRLNGRLKKQENIIGELKKLMIWQCIKKI